MSDQQPQQQRPSHLLTRHGVRNLNGPNMDGRNHNGRPASCLHYKNPELPTYPQERVIAVVANGGPTSRLVRVHHCSLCGEARFTDEED